MTKRAVIKFEIEYDDEAIEDPHKWDLYDTWGSDADVKNVSVTYPSAKLDFITRGIQARMDITD